MQTNLIITRAQRFTASSPQRLLWFFRLSTFLAAFGLASCGTFVPKMSERVDLPDDRAGELLVQAIVRSVRCELRNGVTTAINEDVDSRAGGKGKTYSDFLDKWGAEVALTLTIVEKTTVSPSTLLTPSSLVSIAGGVSASARATRLEKINLFYSIRELYLPDGADMRCQWGRCQWIVSRSKRSENCQRLALAD